MVPAGTARRLSARLNTWARYVAIFIGFSIPISTALDNILCVLLLLLWAGGGDYREKLHVIRNNPVAVAALVFLALTIIGLAWSIGPPEDRILYLKKYSNVLLIPVFVTLFTQASDRQRGWFAFAVALAVTVILSYGVALELIPNSRVITGVPDDPTVFKKRIAHNILMAFGVLLFFVLAERARSARLYWLWMGLCAAAFVDVLMVQGRTGYVVLPAVVALLLFQKWRWKGLIAAVALVSVALVGAYQFSSSFHDRILKASSEAANWKSGTPADTSVGFRLEFYQHTLSMIQQHPWIGVGTGGFKSAYAHTVRGKEMNATVNPHNLYLMIAAEFGMVGLAVLFYLLFVQWRYARELSPPHHVTLARGLVLVFAVAGLFNTLIIDHTESMFFAWGCGLLFAGLPRSARGEHASAR